MATQKSNIQAKFKELRKSYAKQLPKKLGEIKALWLRLIKQNWNWNTAKELHRHLHTLAGSAPTFGCTEVGQRARSAEQVIKEWVTTSQQPEEADCDTLSKLLANLFAADTGSAQETPKPETAPSWVSRPADMHLIYLIDNDSDFAGELATQLSHFDYQVKIFSNSANIDEAMENERPSAIIANIALPEGDLAGVILIRGIKARYDINLPIIFVSRENDFDSRMQAVRAGGDAYFVKPLDIAPLVDQLDQLTQKHPTEPFRILLIDDDHSLARHYSLTLQQAGMDVTTVTEPQNIISALAEVQPDLILMDVYMPNYSGIELAKLIRQQDAYLSIPIVYLSSENNLKKQFNALRMGGDDFLIKPVSDQKLGAIVEIRAERSRTLNALMMTDSLTGLLKHTKIKEQLASEVSRAIRANTLLSFAMIDIDNFKAINDTHGHLAGDRILKSLAHLLQQRLRQNDSIGRYGGEEFAAVLPDCSLDNAKQLSEEICKAFSEINFLHDNQEIRATISIGIADLSDHNMPENIIRAADEALYAAKENGRNRVEIA